MTTIVPRLRRLMLALLPTMLICAGCRSGRHDDEPPAPSSVGATPSVSAPAVATPLAAPSPSATTDAGDCIVIDEGEASGSEVTLDGKVESGRHSHPNGSMFTFYTLRLPAPRCVRGSSEVQSVGEVQLAPMSDAIRLDRLVGKRVRIKGSAFGWMTAWHVRPVLVSFDAIESPV